jgi:hypothetical protein
VLERNGKSVLTHMNHVLPHKNSQKPKKKFYFIFSNFSWPKKKCVLAHKFSNILWFYHTFSVVKTHKNNVLPHKKYLFLIINLKFYIQNFFKNVVSKPKIPGQIVQKDCLMGRPPLARDALQISPRRSSRIKK